VGVSFLAEVARDGGEVILLVLAAGGVSLVSMLAARSLRRAELGITTRRRRDRRVYLFLRRTETQL
jgi:hypothetical protein